MNDIFDESNEWDQKIRNFKKSETNPKVKGWLDLYISSLGEAIQRSKDLEEQEF